MNEPTIQETDLKWKTSNISKVYYRWFDKIKQTAGIKSIDKVLEIGCGLGYFGETFGVNYTGLEIDKERVAFCKAKGLNVVEGNAELLPFPDESFDVVVWVDVLHHTNYEKVVKEIKRVLKPNGVYCGVEPLPSFIRKLAFSLKEHHEKFDIFLEPSVLNDVFKADGYKKIDMFYPLSGGFSRKEISSFYADIHIAPLCWKYIIWGRKSE